MVHLVWAFLYTYKKSETIHSLTKGKKSVCECNCSVCRVMSINARSHCWPYADRKSQKRRRNETYLVVPRRRHMYVQEACKQWEVRSRHDAFLCTQYEGYAVQHVHRETKRKRAIDERNMLKKATLEVYLL